MKQLIEKFINMRSGRLLSRDYVLRFHFCVLRLLSDDLTALVTSEASCVTFALKSSDMSLC